MECSFRHNSPSTGCYAVFHPINHTEEGVSYHKIIKSLVDTTASDCINTLPNGVYSVSVLDVLSYEEGSYNNTAVTISSLITISTSNTPILNQTTIILNGILCLCICVYVYMLIDVLPVCVTCYMYFSLFSSANPSSSSYNPVSTSGPSVLIIILSSIIPIIMIVVVLLLIVPLIGLSLTKKRKKSNFYH